MATEINRVLNTCSLLTRGFSCLRSGSDVLFVECLLARQVLVDVVVPFAWPTFTMACVDFGQTQLLAWRRRVEHILVHPRVTVHSLCSVPYAANRALSDLGHEVLLGMVQQHVDKMGGVQLSP